MSELFFEKPILNSPYAYPARHWELDADGQPTQQIMEWRRSADFITPIPKPRKRKGKQAAQQEAFVMAEEIDAVCAWLVARTKEGVAPHEIDVFVRSDAQLPRAHAAAQQAGLPTPCSTTRWKQSPARLRSVRHR